VITGSDLNRARTTQRVNPDRVKFEIILAKTLEKDRELRARRRRLRADLKRLNANGIKPLG